jgi:hypothetical protein
MGFSPSDDSMISTPFNRAENGLRRDRVRTPVLLHNTRLPARTFMSGSKN